MFETIDRPLRESPFGSPAGSRSGPPVGSPAGSRSGTPEQPLDQFLNQAIVLLAKVVDGLDPEVLAPSFAAQLVEVFAKGERLCAAGKTLASRRVSTSGVWRLEGEASAAAWMAKKTGTTLTNAIKVLETSKRVADLPETDKALRGGKLSEVQAEQIASAAAADPVREKDLLSTAWVSGVSAYDA